jgi:hypothetical protein
MHNRLKEKVMIDECVSLKTIHFHLSNDSILTELGYDKHIFKPQINSNAENA